MSNVVTEETVSEIVQRWRGRLGLGDGWAIGIALCAGDEWPDDHAGSVAYVRPDMGSFEAQIHINKSAAEVDRDPLEHIILHEMVHIVLWPLWLVVRDSLGKRLFDSANDMNEAAVEQLTRALLASARSHE